MPIQLLSASTSRTLTSAQTLNNATSVIKELVDNALDACASSISIEIAANTLDKIVVKDDGFGIGVQDRQLLCRRGHTSKITNLDDLAKLGGTFLGFRGTALASIAELSKEVVIVTRVDGEQPATTMTFGKDGKLLSSASASHNVGTTVRIENLLAAIPVRRQVVLRNPSKILDDIKRLLQGYAFARPKVKMSLKVLKAKNDKANWSFAACRDGEQLLAAAIQVVGNPIASLCKLHNIQSTDSADQSSKYTIKALLIDAQDTDLSKAGGAGQYISVDGRPVSHEKGVMKEMVKKYKTHLQQANGKKRNIAPTPFIAIHLSCPSRSYDVNIEPAKDMVLFHERPPIMELATALFTKCYGEIEEHTRSGRKDISTRVQKHGPPSFDVLLSRKRPETDMSNNSNAGYNAVQSTVPSPSLPDASSDGRPLTESPTESMNNEIRPVDNDPEILSKAMLPEVGAASEPCRNMQTSYDDFGDVDLPSHDLDAGEEEVYDPNDITVNNPFTRAKVHSLQRTDTANISDCQTSNRALDPSIRLSSIESPIAKTPTPIPRISANSVFCLPSPKTSPLTSDPRPYQNLGPPFPRRNKRAYEGEEYEEHDTDENPSPSQQPHGPRQSDLANWVRSPAITAHTAFRSAAEVDLHNLPSDNLMSRSDSIQITTALQNTKQQLRSPNNPFRSPLKQHRPSAIGKNVVAHNKHVMSPPRSGHPVHSVQHTDDDLQHILDFEQRKKLVNQQLRFKQTILSPADLTRIQQSSDVAADLLLSQSSKSRSDGTSISQDDIEARFGSDVDALAHKTSNPHQNRYLAAVRRLEPQSGRRTQLQSSANPKTHNGTSTIPSHSTTASTDTATQNSPPNLPSTDPRGYLINHQRSLDHNHSISSPRPKHNVKRCKSSRLPFESIPSSASTNHTLLAIPSTPFVSPIDLSAKASSLAQHDLYVRTGRIESINWPTSIVAGKDVAKWQTVLEMLVKEQYRMQFRTVFDADADNGDINDNLRGREGESNTDSGTDAVIAPTFQIPLLHALQAHVDHHTL